jgi:hypothetical protein
VLQVVTFVNRARKCIYASYLVKHTHTRFVAEGIMLIPFLLFALPLLSFIVAVKDIPIESKIYVLFLYESSISIFAQQDTLQSESVKKLIYLFFSSTTSLREQLFIFNAQIVKVILNYRR